MEQNPLAIGAAGTLRVDQSAAEVAGRKVYLGGLTELKGPQRGLLNSLRKEVSDQGTLYGTAILRFRRPD